MKKTKIVSRQEEVVEDIICNKCGNSLKSECGYEGLEGTYIEGGYGSKIGDGVVCNFSLCETCLLWLFQVFKHSPYEEDQE